MKTHTLLYAAAITCDAVSLALIYNATVTGDAGLEWVVWLLVIAGFALIVGGWLTERRYKREHPEEYPPEKPKKK